MLSLTTESWNPYTRDPVGYRLLSGGAGYNTNRFKFDAAVQFRWATFFVSDFPSVTRLAQGSSTPDAVGRAAAHEWRLKVSVIYRMADTDKLKGALRRIFG